MALVVKNPPANAGDVRDLASIPGSGRSLGGGYSNLLQYSCLENPMDRGVCRATAHRITQRVRHDWRDLGQHNKKESVVTQLCPTLCNPMDCSPPGSSVHGVLQARILEWIAMPSSKGSSRPRDQTGISYISCIWQVDSLPLRHQRSQIFPSLPLKKKVWLRKIAILQLFRVLIKI